MSRRTLHQLVVIAGESVVFRRIDAVGEIEAQRDRRGSVANAEAHRVNHIVEIRWIALIRAERNFAEARIDVARVFKQHAVDVRAVQRKAQFRVVEKQSGAAQRKSGERISRTRLIFRESALVLPPPP